MRSCNPDLREEAFRLTPDPYFFYANSRLLETYSCLLSGIHNRRGILVLSGETGTGKTILLRKCTNELKASNHLTFYFCNPPASFKEIVETCCQQTGVVNEAADTGQSLTNLINLLDARLRKEGIAALIVDEAQDVPSEVLRELLLFAEFQKDNGGKLLQIVLAGLPVLETKLDATELRSFRSSIAVQCCLEPLKEHDIRPYINHRLRMAGWNNTDLFSAEAISRIASHSGGIPRQINILCGNALQMANLESQLPVTAEAVEQAALAYLINSDAPTSETHPRPLSSKPMTGEGAPKIAMIPAPHASGNLSSGPDETLVAVNDERPDLVNKTAPTPSGSGDDSSTAIHRRGVLSPWKVAAGFVAGAVIGSGSLFLYQTQMEPVKGLLTTWNFLASMVENYPNSAQQNGSYVSIAHSPEVSKEIGADDTQLLTHSEEAEFTYQTSTQRFDSTEPATISEIRPEEGRAQLSQTPPPVIRSTDIPTIAPLTRPAPGDDLMVTSETFSEIPVDAVAEMAKLRVVEIGDKESTVAVELDSAWKTPIDPVVAEGSPVQATTPAKPHEVAQNQSTAKSQEQEQAFSTDEFIERGNQLIKIGDLVSARLFFELAAENGNPKGFTAVAITYDPVFYEATGVLGVAPDPEKALAWYRQAIKAGDIQAKIQLNKLRTWLERAAAQGGGEAKRLLSQLD